MIKSTPQAIEIYELYPRKIAKPEALRAILKAIARDGFELVRDKTKAYAERAVEAVKYDYEQKFIPYPATFFNRSQYADDLDAIFPKEKHGKNKQLNKRNIGVAGAGQEDYGAAAKRKVERQMAQAANQHPPQAQGNGT